MNQNDYISALVDTAAYGNKDEKRAYRNHLYYRFHYINSDKFNRHVLSLKKLESFISIISSSIEQKLQDEFRTLITDIIGEYLASIESHNSQDDGKLSKWLLTDTKEFKYGLMGSDQKKAGFSFFKNQTKDQDQDQTPQ